MTDDNRTGPSPSKKSAQLTTPGTHSEELNLAARFQEQGDLSSAENLLRSIIRVDRKNFEAHYALGLLYHQAGHEEPAIAHMRVAVRLRPDSLKVVMNLGALQHNAGQLAGAQATLENAIAIDPNSAAAHVSLGKVLIDRNNIDAGILEFGRALALQPENAELHKELGLLYNMHGNFGQAANHFKSAIMLKPNYGDAHYNLALLQKQKEYTDDIGQLEHAFQSHELSDKDRSLIGFSLAKIFDDLKLYDKAFGYLQEANRIDAKLLDYSIEHQREFFDRHKQGINRQLIQRCKNYASLSDKPIFVVGMPRSGTSLVEQILSSHPLVLGAGEVEHSRLFVDGVVKHTGQPFPLGIDQVQPQILQAMSSAYIARLTSHDATAERVIDKLPHNFLRIGLFAATMPNAKIIVCERNQFDLCLSIYQHHFSAAHGYAASLIHLGQYYKLYEELMAYWQALLPGHMYTVNYQKLVTDTHDQVRQLLEYCDLSFHPNTLTAHRTERAVDTPSASQVREPIHSESIDRWKNYKKHLKPLFEVLQ